MSDFDLDRLGDLWRAEPDPKEMERLERAATAAARRARWGQLSDAVLAVVVSAAVLVLVWSNPTVPTAVVGGAAILLMLFGTIRQRQLRKVELEALTGTTEEMLDQSIARVQATKKRVIYGLVGAIPGTLLGIAFAATLEGGTSALWEAWRGSESRRLVAYILVPTVVILYFYLASNFRRSRAELGRLSALRDAFRRESEASEA